MPPILLWQAPEVWDPCSCGAGKGRSGTYPSDRLDRVDLSNLHRQQYFMRHVGMMKVEALKSILLEINPFLEISVSESRVTEENCGELLATRIL